MPTWIRPGKMAEKSTIFDFSLTLRNGPACGGGNCAGFCLVMCGRSLENKTPEIPLLTAPGADGEMGKLVASPSFRELPGSRGKEVLVHHLPKEGTGNWSNLHRSAP